MKKWIVLVLWFCAATVMAEQQSPIPVTNLVGTVLINKDAEEVSVDTLKGQTVALYFSASWCPPCRQFTPVLKEVYDEWKANDRPVEVILVSSDYSDRPHINYMKRYEMNWLTIPFMQPETRELPARFRVSGIPALVVLDPEGDVISYNGVSEVYMNGKEALDDWLAASKKED